MTTTRGTVPKAFFAACVAGAISVLACQTVSKGPLETTAPNIFRVVLRIDFDDVRGPERLRILDVSQKVGVIPHSPIEDRVKVHSRELREGSMVAVRYTLRSGDAALASDYFLVSRRAHTETLDHRLGAIGKRIDGTLNRVTVRVPLPLVADAQELTLETLEFTGNWTRDKASTGVDASFDLSASSASGQLQGSLSQNYVGKELIHEGDSPASFDIVFLGDGFTEGQSLDFYRSEVDAIKEQILEKSHPLGALSHAFNIWRVDIVTTDDWNGDGMPDEGVDVPDPPCVDFRPAADRPNVLGTHFCGKFEGQQVPTYELLGSKNWEAIYDFADFATTNYDDYIIVLANDRDFGGAGYPFGGGGSVDAGPVAMASVASSMGNAPETCVDSGNQPQPGCEEPDWWEDVRPLIHAMAVHELGHMAFGLGDEYYPSLQESSVEYSGDEPGDPNVTKASSLAAVKWSHLVVASQFPVPRHRVPGCLGTSSESELLLPDLPDDLVGLFEGATTNGAQYACGLFRPRHKCKMNRTYKASFCPVCREAILKKLAPYAGEGVHVLLDTVTVKNVPEDFEPALLEYQVAADWIPSTPGQQGTSTGQWPLNALGVSQPVPEWIPYESGPGESDLFFSVEDLLPTLGAAPSNQPSQIRVSYRVSVAGDTELTSGSFNVEPRTGVHIVDLEDFRCTISVVAGGS